MYRIRACTIDDRIHLRFPRGARVESLVEWIVWPVREDAGNKCTRIDNAIGQSF